jgi:hypothetical protein
MGFALLGLVGTMPLTQGFIMLSLSFSILTTLVVASTPAARIAVLLDDPASNTPAQASIESTLQTRGYSVVAAEVSAQMRKVVAPEALLKSRLPKGLSVFEADAILVGAISYGEPQEMDGVRTLPVSLTVKLIDLATGKNSSTLQTSGRGIGILGPELRTRGAKAAVRALFKQRRFRNALKNLGQQSGRVTLIVQDLPNREALLELKKTLERALAGAPVKEIYYAKGLGKLVLGGSKARSMVGPDIADIIGEHRFLALIVDEVANTRIVARFNRARTVRIHALVLQPKLPKKSKKRSQELGRYMTTQMAAFTFARASYQPGRLSRAQARKQAKRLKADVIVESELIGTVGSQALAIRVIDVASGRPIYRGQRFLNVDKNRLQTADVLMSSLQSDLPDSLVKARIGVIPIDLAKSGPRTAENDLKELKD